MKTYNSISDYKSKEKSIVTIGTFDGVHVGHKHILEKLILNAKEHKCESLVLTFFPHPKMVLQESSSVKLLNTMDEKNYLLEKIGVDNLVIHPFDKDFSRLTAEEFVKNILVDKFNIQKIIIGYDHRFGRNRTANINDLIHFGKKYNFEVEEISAQEVNDIAVSSTKIRNAILDGNIALANNYLGYNYFFNGKVVKGKQLGRTIGFPTANIHIEEDYKLIPKNGVYIVNCLVKNISINGIMNIGSRPTVAGKGITIEVYLLDFEIDIYDQNITVNILNYVRDEEKFNSLEDLKIQLELDKKFAIDYFNKL
ncbi:bifunctional riboflavin kinase/FAD synthetase [Flavobacterium sp.]|uniref:bifunctional riboflavin kinase/FAD synthetase n=1 Tax=Flavobacterium sp. TaxID=239 RepID=UPI003753E4A5